MIIMITFEKKSLTSSPSAHKKLRAALFEKYPKEARLARQEAWHAELGNKRKFNKKLDIRIKEIIDSSNVNCWGMIGGPPCQAYSVIGRSRNKGISGYTAEKDKRSYLYRQYLRLIARHKPDFFIMENVKGMLSAKLNGKSLFEKILDDLKRPRKAIRGIGKISSLGYQIFPLVQNTSNSTEPADFIVETENFGVPQARHRVIVMGIKNGFSTAIPSTLKKKRQVTVKEVLNNLPKLRSGLSKEKKENNTYDQWVKKVARITDLKWFKNAPQKKLIK